MEQMQIIQDRNSRHLAVQQLAWKPANGGGQNHDRRSPWELWRGSMAVSIWLKNLRSLLNPVLEFLSGFL